jgi:hypothetical protein
MYKLKTIKVNFFMGKNTDLKNFNKIFYSLDINLTEKILIN